MDQIINLFLIVGIVAGIVGIIALAIYRLANNNIFFMNVPEGEIVTVMFQGRFEKFVAKIDGYWIDPKTGEVWKNEPDDPKEDHKPRPANLPRSFYGVYWLGLFPFATVYSYKFSWNKYTKKEHVSEYIIDPREETVDSMYFKAQYPVRLVGAETVEGLPITVDVLVTTQTVNADFALFKMKNPGWLASLTGSVTAAVRDLIGIQKIDELPKLQFENPDGAKKSALQLTIEQLNDSSIGNPSLKTLVGQKIISVSFLGYKIDEVTTETQKASIARWMDQKASDAKVALQVGANAETDTEARKIREIGKAKGEALLAEAAGVKAKADAVKDNPAFVQVMMAEAVQNQKTATTLVLGAGMVPTMEVRK